MQWRSIRKNNCVIYWIVIYPVDSVVYFSNYKAQKDYIHFFRPTVQHK